MVRRRSLEPITNNVEDLFVGHPQIRVVAHGGSIDPDVSVSPLTSSNSVGAIGDGAITVANVRKEKKSGFPASVDHSMNFDKDIMFKFNTEEILRDIVFTLIEGLLSQIVGNVAKQFAVEAVFEKSVGGGISVYGNNTELVPSLTVSSSDDYIGVEISLETILNKAFTNKSLTYWSSFSGTSRSRLNQPITKTPQDITIGFGAVWLGALTPRAVGTGNGTFFKHRVFPISGSPLVIGDFTANDGANYTGSLDGAYVFKITRIKSEMVGSNAGTTFDMSTATGDNTLTVVVDGTSYAITFTDSATLAIDTVISEINSGSVAGVASKDSDNKVHLSSPTSGTVSVSVANTSLGFTADTVFQLISSNTGTTFDMSTATGDNTLTVIVDSVTYAVTFTDSATLAIDTVISEINAAGAGTIAAKNSDNNVILFSPLGATGVVNVTVANTSLAFTASQPLTNFYPIFELQKLDGSKTQNNLFTGVDQSIENGLTITGPGLLDCSIGDAIVVGAEASSAKSSSGYTAVYSPYPYLDNSKSIGAVVKSDLTITTEELKHKTGIPKLLDQKLVKDKTIMLEVDFEELKISSTGIVSGLAQDLGDLVFDSSIHDKQYYTSAEFILMGLEGKLISFWLPNCEVVSDSLNLAGAEDYSSVNVKLKTNPQNQTNSPNEIYVYRNWDVNLT